MKRRFLFSLAVVWGVATTLGHAALALGTPLRPIAQKIVAIGDIHGDLDVALKALHLAGATDRAGRWIGQDMIVVQVGDQIDRGKDDRQVLNFFAALREEAEAFGGQVISLWGNHEIMNVMGDFRYVNAESFRDFAEHEPYAGEPIVGVPASQQARAAAFAPGGRYAQLLASRKVAAVVGDTVFVHGGLRLEHVEAGLERMNEQVSAWMMGEARRPSFVKESDGPFWMRDYSKGNPKPKTCERLAATLRALGAKRMVVGHTIQDGGINSACHQKVWRIDIGLSSAYRHNLLQVLAIENDAVRIVNGAR